MSDESQILRDIQRRLSNLVRKGRVHSVDFTQTPPRVRVEYAPRATTTWLPWVGGRASSQSRTDWEPLAVGEQCLILSQSGELSAGVVLPAMLDSQSPPPSTSADEHVTQYADGTQTRYNRKTHQLSVMVKGDVSVQCDNNLSCQAGGDITLSATGNMKLKAARIDLNE
ncbi:phage baseplate assembly protein V [Celerinatantimonas diazotrophica]|uniref:Phage baseplate assembly protein V n=1 Tax=Celerinatantimonas diazotrophica TaxID=412034 RepID=A0A4R1K4T2_9GAMM|nr:phage baseplate assembly protein V [Celerinatantimonas diazotrophica]TCK58950.1 phage baseplate assembly protein V [Celerinatantimonas diazotrophica]CAG9297584.1 hypothetical protein CEDIAZO_02772 [Celerinatantimonas diazotrophica]